MNKLGVVLALRTADYGDDALNRLAIALAALERMTPHERAAAMYYFFGRYRSDIAANHCIVS